MRELRHQPVNSLPVSSSFPEVNRAASVSYLASTDEEVH